MADLQAQLRSMRIVHGIFLAAAFAYPAIAEYLHPHPAKIDPVFFYGILIVAAWDALLGVALRQRWLAKAIEGLRANVDDVAALARWRQAQLVPAILALSVCFFGFALRFTGAPLARVAPLYIGAVLLLVLFRPADPLS